MSPNLPELVGYQKNQSDLQVEQVRIRYSDTHVIQGQSGQRIMMRFPKIQGKFLNLSTINFNLTLNLAGSDTQMDVYSISSLFSRVRVLSSSNVLCDIQDFGLLSTTLLQADSNFNQLRIVVCSLLLQRRKQRQEVVGATRFNFLLEY